MRKILCWMLAGTGLLAQEVSLSVGPLRRLGFPERTYAWHMGYSQRFTEDLAWSFAWYNEGHVPRHHRDGPALSLWRLFQRPDGLRLAVGLGMYRTYDTEEFTDGYGNHHGSKGLFSLTASKPLGEGFWRTHLQLDQSFGGTGFATRSLRIGMAYSMRKADAVSQKRFQADPDAEVISVSYGKAILNSFQSEQDMAWQVEYRRSLRPGFAWSVAYADEGNLEHLEREGLALQAWFLRHHLGGRLEFGLGLGPVWLRTRDATDTTARQSLAGRANLLVAWHLAESPWQLRAQWIRTRTSDSRDTDLLLGGVALAF